VEEVSLILKNNLTLTIEEFRILDRYSCAGRIWSIVYRNRQPPYILRYKSIEYILDPEAITMFGIVSDNILATWDTRITKNFGPEDELYLQDSIIIKPYTKYH